MGTRADFYIGRGVGAEWLGSIAWDGYPDGIPMNLLAAKDAAKFRRMVREFISKRDDGTKPKDGWPWPWNDSGTTDYAYAFDKGHVRASCFGGNWFNPRRPRTDDGEPGSSNTVFPNMKDCKRRPIFGAHSGVIVITAK